MTEIRAEVVAALVTGQWFDAAQLDPTTAELSAAGDSLAELAKSELRAAGQLAPERSPLDYRMSELRAFARVFEVLEPATPAAVMATDPTIGQRLKVLAPGFARRVTGVLETAGLLDPGD